MIYYQTILDLCDERGVKVTNVEKELGFSKGALKKVEKNSPSADKIYRLAEYFDVPMETFFREELNSEDLDASVRHAELIRENEELKELEDRVEADMENTIHKAPVFDVAAGQGRINGAYTDEYMDEELSEDYSFCSVHGDSMYPILHDGDIVKVHHQTTVGTNDIAIVKVDGETATAKYIEVTDNGVWLRAENKEVFADRFYNVQEVLSLPITIIGKVVELRREI